MSQDKQAQLQARQDTLRLEIQLLLADNRREAAIQHYQKKCACSATRAVEFIDGLEKAARIKKREDFLNKLNLN